MRKKVGCAILDCMKFRQRRVDKAAPEARRFARFPATSFPRFPPFRRRRRCFRAPRFCWRYSRHRRFSSPNVPPAGPFYSASISSGDFGTRFLPAKQAHSWNISQPRVFRGCARHAPAAGMGFLPYSFGRFARCESFERRNISHVSSLEPTPSWFPTPSVLPAPFEMYTYVCTHLLFVSVQTTGLVFPAFAGKREEINEGFFPDWRWTTESMRKMIRSRLYSVYDNYRNLK